MPSRSSRTRTATVWTIKLRKGVTFHNGKPLTAEDVIYSYQRVVSGNLGGASSLASCDIKNMKALDYLTVQIPCHVPFATFVSFDHRLLLLPEHPARRFRPEEAGRHRAVRVRIVHTR